MQPTTSELIIAFVAGIAILMLLAGYIVYFLFLYQRKQQENIAEKRNREIRFQEQLFQAQLEIKEQTLQHIARELHDNLGQIASLIKINLTTLQLTNQPASVEKLEQTKELVRNMIADIKSLSQSLSGDRATQKGIAEAIRSDIERIRKTGHLQAHFSTAGTIPSLDENTTTILYRMTQEILNNAMKHSGAHHVSVSLQSSEKLFTLVCLDDGVGFDMQAAIDKGGMGLINLQNRARLINARMDTQTAPGQGTKISIELDVSNGTS